MMTDDYLFFFFGTVSPREVLSSMTPSSRRLPSCMEENKSRRTIEDKGHRWTYQRCKTRKATGVRGTTLVNSARLRRCLQRRRWPPTRQVRAAVVVVVVGYGVRVASGVLKVERCVTVPEKYRGKNSL